MEHGTESERLLQGMRLLVADDEFLVAVFIEEVFCDAGAQVVTVATLSAALQSAADLSLSAALLDVRLGRQTTEAVADELAARGVPFIFYSGQALPDQIRAKYPEAQVLVKPSRHEDLIQAILRAVRR